MKTITLSAITGFIALSLFLSASEARAVQRSAETQDASQVPELDCVIEPGEIADIGSAVPGVIETLQVDRGDLVTKGTVLSRLESEVEQAALELAKTQAEFTTNIELGRENAEYSRRSQSRNQELFKKSAISQQDIDQLETERRIAVLQVRKAKEDKRIAELEYHRALEALKRRTIRSPFDGVVVERFKSVGEYVEDMPMLRVAQLDPLRVEVIVPVEHMGRIHPGMRANVAPAIPGSENLVATVERVDRVADAGSATFGVRLSLPNPDYSIPSGLRCRMALLPGSMDTQSRLFGKAAPASTEDEDTEQTPGSADALSDDSFESRHDNQLLTRN